MASGSDGADLFRASPAPSVLSPEIVIPSAGACFAPLSRVFCLCGPWGLSVSGAVAPSAPALGTSAPASSPVKDPLTLVDGFGIDKRCGTFRAAATLRRQNIHQCRVVTDQGVQRDRIERRVKGIGRVGERRAQPARIDERA